MSEIVCKRCGQQAAPLPGAPLPGEPGLLVHAGTCSACWEEWKGEQVKLINEKSLSPGRPEDYTRLVELMLDYLGLSEGRA